jgi:hypothetical protein
MAGRSLPGINSESFSSFQQRNKNIVTIQTNGKIKANINLIFTANPAKMPDRKDKMSRLLEELPSFANRQIETKIGNATNISG